MARCERWKAWLQCQRGGHMHKLSTWSWAYWHERAYWARFLSETHDPSGNVWTAAQCAEWKSFIVYISHSAVKLQVDTPAIYLEMQCLCHTRACLSTVSRKAPPQKAEAAIASVLQAPSHKAEANRYCIEVQVTTQHKEFMR